MDRKIIKKGIDIAVEAMKRAYAPYSGVHVGACAITRNGECYSGCNVENASYGLTMCAERNAVFNAVAHGHRDVEAVVLCSDMDDIMPCGACLQVMGEFSPQGGMVIMVTNTNGEVKGEYTLRDLLPRRFVLDNGERPKLPDFY